MPNLRREARDSLIDSAEKEIDKILADLQKSTGLGITGFSAKSKVTIRDDSGCCFSAVYDGGFEIHTERFDGEES